MALVSRIILEENFIKEFEELSKKFKCLDLGMGFPNYVPSQVVTKSLADVLSSNCVNDHQYTNPNGHPKLTEAFSKLYSKLLQRNLDTDKEILITAGSSEALFCAIMSIVAPEDEVIIIEPFFSVFVTLVKMAGGIPKFISLEMENDDDDDDDNASRTTRNWKLDQEELAGIFNEKTKMIIVNTPHNPTGKVFDMQELTFIADLCKKWNVICLADEVYERMVFKSKVHIRIAALPGMFDRTITIGAAEKSFAVTGWQIGYAYGASDLIKKMQILHQYAVYNASTPLQIAFAKLFDHEYKNMDGPDSLFQKMELDLREKRNYLFEVLKKTNFRPILPDGGMYVLADISKLAQKCKIFKEKDDVLDREFVKLLLKKHFLLSFPVSVFCSESNRRKYEHYIRLCFVKDKITLEGAAEIFENFKKFYENSMIE